MQPTLFACLRIIGLAGAAVIALGVQGSTQTAPAENTRARQLAEGGNDTTGFDMAPETRLEVVQAAVDAIPVALPAGPVTPTWDSLETHFRVPPEG